MLLPKLWQRVQFCLPTYDNNMKEIKKYVWELLGKANSFLNDNYHIDSFKISDFQLLNFYIAEKALNNKTNLFIKTFNNFKEEDIKEALIILASSFVFQNNYLQTQYSYGYESDEIYTRFWSFIFNIPENEIPRKISNNNKIFIITEKSEFLDLIKRLNSSFIYIDIKKLKKFIHQRNVNQLLPLKNKFFKSFEDLYDAVEKIIGKGDAKFFKEEIRKSINNDISKAIPYLYITKSGNKTSNLNISPMIVITNDFETLDEFVLERGIKIESLIIIGKNKYKETDLTKIKRSLREGEISNCIILGDEHFEDNNAQFIKWRWTYEEFAILEDLSLGNIESLQIQESPFEAAINYLQSFLCELESIYSINLNNVKTLRKFLFPLVLSKESNSRNTNQLDYVQHLLLKVSRECIIENLYNQNIDAGQEILKVEELINGIFNQFKNDKFRLLNSLNYDVIIVPEPLLSNWKNEYKSKAKLISLKEFLKIQNNFTTDKQVVVLSLFGNGIQPFDVVRNLLNTRHNYKFLCYQEESEILDNLKYRYFNEIIKEYTSKDREKITGLKYEIQPIEIKVSDLIENLHEKSLKESKEYYYEDSEQINYEIEFEEKVERIISDGSKNVLLFSNGTWNKSKVSNLIQKDRVRIYNNLSKEKLFDIAAQQDSKGRFNKVDSDSKIWKESLIKYLNQKTHSNPFYTETDLMNELQKSGLTISNPMTIKKWLAKEDKERFPNSANNLIAIKTTLNDPILNDNFESIKRSKRFYRGIMISLGRDLSDDVMEYIVSGGKSIGKILSNFTEDEIKIFIQKAAPERTIKNISITEEDESI